MALQKSNSWETQVKTLVKGSGQIDTARFSPVPMEPEVTQCEASSYNQGTASAGTDVEVKAYVPVPKQETNSTFYLELRTLLNKHNKEQGSNTPDYMLASFLSDMLIAFDKVVSARERWYGRKVF